MPFLKGYSGNPGGKPKEKPFADALRMEIKAAGGDHKALRKVARALLDKAEDGDLQAIREVADRLDGKVGSNDAAEGTGEVNLFINTGIIRPGDYGYKPPVEHEGRLIEGERVDSRLAQIDEGETVED